MYPIQPVSLGIRFGVATLQLQQHLAPEQVKTLSEWIPRAELPASSIGYQPTVFWVDGQKRPSALNTIKSLPENTLNYVGCNLKDGNALVLRQPSLSASSAEEATIEGQWAFHIAQFLKEHFKIVSNLLTGTNLSSPEAQTAFEAALQNETSPLLLVA